MNESSEKAVYIISFAEKNLETILK